MYILFHKPKSVTKFTEHSIRFYGQTKLPKPKELKGIKQFTSIDYIPKKCRNQAFIKNNDIWIKHGDYFSPSLQSEPHEFGMPLNYFTEKHMGKDRAPKFIYEDSWGDMVLRNEAWIILKDLVVDIKNEVFELDILREILRQKERMYGFDEYELCSSDMERFYENVVKETKKYITKN